MHEMGLMDAVLRRVESACAQEEYESIDKIVLEVGELSGVVTNFLFECFDAIKEDTPFEHTVLEVESVPGTLYCNDCDFEFRPNLEDLRCPQCLSRNLTPRSGQDFTIKSVEVS